MLLYKKFGGFLCDSLSFSVSCVLLIIMPSCCYYCICDYYALYKLIFFMQIDHGVLAACFNLQQGEGSYCIIQLFEPMDTYGISVSNEYDCPLLSLSLDFFFVCLPIVSYNLCPSFRSVLLLAWLKTSLLHVSLNAFLCHHKNNSLYMIILIIFMLLIFIFFILQTNFNCVLSVLHCYSYYKFNTN